MEIYLSTGILFSSTKTGKESLGRKCLELVWYAAILDCLDSLSKHFDTKVMGIMESLQECLL